MEEICKNTVEALKRRGFDAVYCATAEEASSAVMAEVDAVQRVGMGGSVTMKELGVTERLNESGKLQTRGADCDLFLLSANAVTEDGRIVNIDGNGNRVAAMIYGPDSVIVVAGMNKLVPDVMAAVSRARSEAAPVNIQRFDLKTPCKVDGLCHDCNSPDCVCNYIVRTRRCKPAGKIKVILVGEVLGY